MYAGAYVGCQFRRLAHAINIWLIDATHHNSTAGVQREREREWREWSEDWEVRGTEGQRAKQSETGNPGIGERARSNRTALPDLIARHSSIP